MTQVNVPRRHAGNDKTMVEAEIIGWLLGGDVAIQYQTHRDLLGQDRPDLRARIATEGWGKSYLDSRNPDGAWGIEFYRPKWTSTHYTLLDLKALAITPQHPQVREQVHRLLPRLLSKDGGIGTSPGLTRSDVCVNGMFLNYASYFGMPQDQLCSIVDFLLGEQMGDGGFNCQSNRAHPCHSSLHSTLSVLEGILEYSNSGYFYRRDELQQAADQSRGFILLHRLYKSDHTGEIIDKRFLQLAHPARWYYNILRSLDHFRAAGHPHDPRMNDALAVLRSKRRRDGLWLRQAAHPGEVFFVMEPTRSPSRWTTLLSLRVLGTYPGKVS